MQRIIDAPDKEWLTLEELATWLGCSVSVLRGLIRRGVCPPGEPFGRRTRRWHWRTALWVSWALSEGWHRRRKKESPAVPEKGGAGKNS